VKPVIAAVLGRRDQLLFTPETAQQLREQSEAGLADVVEQAARDGARPPDRPHQLYLLLALADERTITLEQPIVHVSFGPGSGFVRGQRYTSLAALKQRPRTTAELLATSARTDRPTTTGRDGFAPNACPRQPSAVPPYLTPLCFTRANTTTRAGLCVRRAASREDCESDTTPASRFGGRATRVVRQTNGRGNWAVACQLGSGTSRARRRAGGQSR
jgi:hypothetical protein